MTSIAFVWLKPKPFYLKNTNSDKHHTFFDLVALLTLIPSETSILSSNICNLCKPSSMKIWG